MSEAAVAEATETQTQVTETPTGTESTEATPLAVETEGGESTETTGAPGTETEAQPAEDEHLAKALAAAKKAAAEETEARLKREWDEQQEQARQYAEYNAHLESVNRSYRERIQRIDAHLQAVERGEVALNRQGLLQEWNQHHAQSMAARDYEWEKAFNTFIHEELGEQTAKELDEARRTGKVKNYWDALKELKNRVTKSSQDGWLSPAQVELREATAAKKAVDDFKRTLDPNVAPATNGNRPLPSMNWEQADAAYNRGEITDQQWRSLTQGRRNGNT